MKHTLRNVAFDVADAMNDFSNYSYASPNEADIVVVHLATAEALDAESLLAQALERYRGAYGPTVIYSSPVRFKRGNGASVPGVEGERHDANDSSKRLRFAIGAIAGAQGKAVVLYEGTARPGSLQFIHGIFRTVFLLGEPSASIATPPHWARQQASCLWLAVPEGWTVPSMLLFQSDVELRVTVDEPLAPEGTIDLDYEIPNSHSRVLNTRTETVAAPGHGWAGEWRIGVDADPAKEMLIRKMSVTLAHGSALNVYAKGPASSSAHLEAVWRTFRSTLALGGGAP